MARHVENFKVAIQDALRAEGDYFNNGRTGKGENKNQRETLSDGATFIQFADGENEHGFPAFWVGVFVENAPRLIVDTYFRVRANTIMQRHSFLAKDDSGVVWLFHTGNVGGGVKGVSGTKKFQRWNSDDELLAVPTSTGAVSGYRITPIDSPDFADIVRYIDRVREFRDSMGIVDPDIVKEVLKSPQDAARVAMRIPHRQHQNVFRSAMRKAYRERCAFCGFGNLAALEAAHIIPYHAGTVEQKLSPTNGLLLCAIHHKLFDAGCIKIVKHLARLVMEYKIGPRAVESYDDLEYKMTVALNGQCIRLPTKKKLRPTIETFQLGAQIKKEGRKKGESNVV